MLQAFTQNGASMPQPPPQPRSQPLSCRVGSPPPIGAGFSVPPHGRQTPRSMGTGRQGSDLAFYITKMAGQGKAGCRPALLLLATVQSVHQDLQNDENLGKAKAKTSSLVPYRWVGFRSRAALLLFQNQRLVHQWRWVSPANRYSRTDRQTSP
jgi:hypothetical protein